MSVNMMAASRRSVPWEAMAGPIRAAARGAFGLAYLTASLYGVLGETEEAMTWLERAYEERDPQLIIAKTNPRLDPLRSDPRWDDLMRRIGFPES